MIDIRRLSLRAGDFEVRDVTIEIGDREYFVLLGPNGSGKSLLLQCLCGLVRATAGEIRIDGRDVTRAEPRRRSIGYVPQDLGLFPHLDVARNLTFPLRVRGTSHRRALARLEGVVEILGLGPLLARSPLTLSGGERQKASLARALALRPALLLLDEPVSALDAPTRKEVLAELRRVQREFAVATIHVCHSIEEARAVADRAGVLIDGCLAQAGRLEDLLARPASAAVARLLGAVPTSRTW